MLKSLTHDITSGSDLTQIKSTVVYILRFNNVYSTKKVKEISENHGI